MSMDQDWIRTEANFGRIGTGSDCSFFKFGVSGLDRTDKFFVILMWLHLNISKILIVIRFHRLVKVVHMLPSMTKALLGLFCICNYPPLLISLISTSNANTVEWQRWAWTGLDILQDTCDIFGSGLDLDIDFWKKLDQDQNICLISITKFTWEWLLRPSNSSGRVSGIPHALISAAHASRIKLLAAARCVVFAFEMWCALSCSWISFGL